MAGSPALLIFFILVDQQSGSAIYNQPFFLKFMYDSLQFSKNQ